jgi:dTDP-4-dehydrorhamnose 3,5-epimerase
LGDKVTIDQIISTPLKRIPVFGGDVLHAMKKSDIGFSGFGESYFSQVESGVVKAWKKHLKMTLNLIVPIGRVRFVFMDNSGLFREEIIGDNNYVRLTIPPGIWFGFKGDFENTSLVLNIANIEHSSEEIERKELNRIKYNWSNQ